MADSKQYELIFLLRAQMDASMRQFSLVGGQIKELEQKIQQYNNTLKSVNAYQTVGKAIADYTQRIQKQKAALEAVDEKLGRAQTAARASVQEYERQQAAIEALNLKIAEEKAEIDSLRAAKSRDGANTKELDQQIKEIIASRSRHQAELKKEEKALKESEAAMKGSEKAANDLLKQKNLHSETTERLQRKLAEEQEKLGALSEALKKAGVDTGNLEDAEKSLAKQIQEATDEQERVTEFANRVKDLSDKFTVLKMAADGVKGAIKPVMRFFGESLDAAAQLEYGMSSVQAVSGATREETEQLTAVVKEMGATTVYTAEESARAMQNMALAGWDAQQMISGLPAVIKLAAASGEDLAEMTSIVSDGMNAFQLSGEAAAVKFADVLAKAATSSNTNVSLLGQSLSYVETTAGNLGYSIEDVSLALAAMANNALKGGVSGSALNTILTRMSGANETAAKQMKEMGLNMYYTMDAMGHTAGEAKDLKTFLDELREAFLGFGDDAQAAQIAAYNLAGMRGMRGLMAIVNQSGEQWEKLTREVYNYSGAADQISGIRMDNYTGQMYLLTSAWDALKTSIGEQFIPTATEALGILTDITNGANDFAQKHPAIVKGIAAGTAALGVMLTVLTALTLAVQAFNFAVATLKITSLMSAGAAFGTIAGLAAAAGVAVASFTRNMDNGVQSVKNLTEAASSTEKNMKEAEKTFDDTTTSIQAAADVANSYIDKLDELGDAARFSGEAQEEYQNTLALLLQVMPELSNCISQTTDEYGRTTYALETTTDALRLYTRELERNAEAQAYQEYLNSMMEDYNEVMKEAAKNQIELTRARHEQENAEKKYNEAVERSKELWEEANRKAEESGGMADAAAYLTQEYYELQDAIEGLGQEYSKAESQVKNYEDAIRKDEEVTAAAKEEMEKAKKAVKDTAEAMGLYSDGQEKATVDAMKFIQSLSIVEEDLGSLTKAYKKAFDAAYENFSGQFSLFEKLEEEDKKTFTMQNLKDALSSQTAYWMEYQKNLETVYQAAKNTGIDLTAIWGGLTDGSREQAAAAAALSKSVEGGDTSELKAYVDQFNEMQETILSLSDFIAQENEEVKEALAKADTDIAEAVANTEANKEAYDAMEKTIQGFLENLYGSGNGVGRVSAAIKAAGEKWKNDIESIFSLRTGGSVFSPRDKKAVTGNTAAGDLWYNAFGGYNQENNAFIPGFAKGTNFAPRGLALVGEQGPELVMMSGGERVIPADKTARLLESGGNFLNGTGRVNAADAGRQWRAAVPFSDKPTSNSAWEAERITHIPAFAEGTNFAPRGLALMGEQGPELVVIPADKTARLLENGGNFPNNTGRVNAAITAAGEPRGAANAFPVPDKSLAHIPAFAEGTSFAPRGLALMGERGPELVMMPSGERAIPAEQKARILESGGGFQSVDDSVLVGAFNLNLKFEVSGNATPETVRELRRYSGELKEAVRQVIREERIDARRKGLA